MIRRLTGHLRERPVDVAFGLVGTLAAVVAFTAEPLVIAGPAIGITTLAGITLILRNGGEDR